MIPVERKVREELDSLVITMELTLMSIVQGIALYFLADASIGLVARMELGFLPYVISGLLIILLFWSRSLMHILTIIRWPLEFIHNFIYISFTLIESVMFKQIGNALNWYALNVLASVLIWLTFNFDLRMIRRTKMDGGGAGNQRFLQMLEGEQVLNIRVIVPVMIVFSTVATMLIYLLPELFIGRNIHLLVGWLQVLLLAGYLVYTLKIYNRIAPLILAGRTMSDE